ncbi:Serine/threonine-protein kinase fray2-like protein [Drosera capensis]
MAEKKKYPIGPEHYTLYEEVGQGVSASVHRALCVPLDQVVAIKILDFERDNCDLNNVCREAQTMNLVDHPNVLRSHCSFVSDHNLWVIMPYMAGGSCLHILKAAHPDGFEEVVIATILREALKGLEYLHQHGHIHRDVKAGNILIDSRGAIKLGDFGVSACLFDSGDRQRMRNTFVGTPCWMAPEVMEQLHGYDCKADIWSFGITALELAHGHAPFSKYPPMKVLLMTLQNAPPGLDYERDRKFSKSFKQMIASCLVKDPSKRPTAKKLLKHSFFKQGRSNDYIARTLLEGLPALGDRIQILKKKDEEMVAQKKMPDGEKEELSQSEYKRGISSWNFDLEDVKAQASLIPDDETSMDKDQGGSSNCLSKLDANEKQFERQFSSLDPCYQAADTEENETRQVQPPVIPSVDTTVNLNKNKCDSVVDAPSTSGSNSEISVSQCLSPCQERVVNMPAEVHRLETVPEEASNTNGLYSHHRRATNGEDAEDKAKVPLVQQKGRFKVTSENVDLEKVSPSPVLHKSHSMQVIGQNPASSLPSPTDATMLNSPFGSVFALLQSFLRTNIAQRDSILSHMKQLSSGDFMANRSGDGPANIATTEKSLAVNLEAAHEREKELLHEVTELQWRLICAQEELQKLKAENAYFHN